MSEISFARLLTIKPMPEDVAGGTHENTKITTSGGKHGTERTTLITFTAEVTMGADLYAQWRNASFRLGDDETKLI
jgi:hypothetical protein